MPVVLTIPATSQVVTGAAVTVPVLVSTFSADAVFSSHIVDSRAHTHGPTALTPAAATITTPCDVASFFSVTLTDPSTLLADPVGAPIDGQKIMWQFTQGPGGYRAMTFGPKFAFSADIPEPTLSPTEGAVDYLGAMYVASADVWRVIALLRGFA